EQHVRQLVEALRETTPPDLREVERELIDRIEKALLDAASASALPVTPDEFGTSPVGLAQARAQHAEEEPFESGEGRLRVVGFEGIDGVQADVVMIQGLDHQHVPQPYAEPWPIQRFDIEEHVERRRYLFLAALRAARRHLHLS